LTARYLQDFVIGNIRRLMIFEPPRHGKSEQTSRRLPPYILGKFPDKQVIFSTYSHELSANMNREAQRIIEHPSYMELFPETKLSGMNVRTASQTDFLRNSDCFEIVGRQGSYRNAGIGGSLTGFGMNVGIIDDPFKNKEEADSTIIRDKVWNWYTTVFLTRLEKNGQILLTMTRWHEDDLAGRILTEMKRTNNADGWMVLSLPAICEKIQDDDPRKIGQALWPNKYDTNALASFRRSLGSRDFSALYQQRPTAMEGGIIKRDWLQHHAHPWEHFDQQITSWDMSFKKTQDSSFVVGQVWQSRGAERQLVYQIRKRMGFTETLKTFQEVVSRFPDATAHLVEDKANGPAIIAALEASVSGLIPVQADVSKEARLSAVAPQYEANQVSIPHSGSGAWEGEYDDGMNYEEEICTFPNGPTNDQCDASSQALAWMRDNSNQVGGAYLVKY